MKKLGFGFMRLPILDKEDQTSIDVNCVNNMVDDFMKKGFTYFDTAYMYHNYASEKTVKKCVVQRYPRDSFTVASKLPVSRLVSVEQRNQIFDEQLSNVGVDYFDYYLLHALNAKNYEIAANLDCFNFIKAKKEAGIIKNIGFSFHDKASVLDMILTNHPFVDFIQLQINYIDWDNDSIESRKCYEVAVKHNKKVVVMEPIKGGALANLPPNCAKIFTDYNKDVSVASWAIRFAASLDNVFMVLSGMSNMEQLTDNVSYMEDFKVLDDSERNVINEVIKELINSNNIGCTACRYCEEGCPKNIAIPDYFAINNQYTSKLLSLGKAKNATKKIAETRGQALECIMCRKCERICPQHLPITDLLKKYAKEIEE